LDFNLKKLGSGRKLNVNEFSKKISEKWKNMSEWEKKNYYEQYAKE
jgi:hypothetical protein